MLIDLVNSNEKVIIDDDAFPLISKLGTLTLNVKGYVRPTNHRKFPLLFHRYIAQFYGINIENKEIHHINGDKLDNRKLNLMGLTPSQHAILEERHINAYNSTGYKNRKGKPNPQQSKRMKDNNPMHKSEVLIQYQGENNPNYKELNLEYIQYCKHILKLTAKDTAKLCNFSQGGFSTVLKTRFNTCWAEI